MNRIRRAMGMGHSDSSFNGANGGHAAEIKVLSADVLTQVLTNLVAEFEHRTKHKVALILTTTGAVKNRVQAGEIADIAIMQRPSINELSHQGVIVANSIVDLGHSSVGVGVCPGAARPDLTSVEGFKRSLLAAKLIGYTDPKNGGGSGVYFGKLIERLGLSEQMKAKTRYPRPGHSAADLIAEGEVDFGIAQPMEILTKPEIELAGKLPPELQNPGLFIFSAGILHNAKEPDVAKALIQFLSGPAAAATIKANGMNPG